MPRETIVGTGLIIINRKNEILLVKDRKKKRGGERDRWGIVGGILETNLSPIENAKKEALEETGYLVKVTGLINIYRHIDKQYDRTSVIFKAIPIKKITTHHTKEISAVRWFRYEDIPWSELRFPKNKEMIKDGVKGNFQPGLLKHYKNSLGADRKKAIQKLRELHQFKVIRSSLRKIH